jgi:outer membrane protein TolC
MRLCGTDPFPNRYKLGIDSYLNVITAQTTYLVNRQTLVNLRMQQMTASV